MNLWLRIRSGEKQTETASGAQAEGGGEVAGGGVRRGRGQGVDFHGSV